MDLGYEEKVQLKKFVAAFEKLVDAIVVAIEKNTKDDEDDE